jgi:hypothetical protein
LTSFRIIFLILICISRVSGQETRIDPVTGVGVIYTATEGMFPKKWYNSKIDAQAVSLSPGEIPYVDSILGKAFSKYPARVLRENLETVYILKTLRFYGLPYGGTFTGHSVYITDNDSDRNYTRTFIESLFHHEFSSILLRSHERYLQKRNWKKANRAGFTYGTGGISAIREGNSSMEYDPGLNKEGFLNRYTQSSLEEDFNVMAQNLFCGGKRFWNIVDEFPGIRKKASLAIAFFHRIDPAFTEVYFRRLADL